MEKKKIDYITDVLTKKDVEQMLDHKDGITLIVSPTGTGKSTFIIEKLVKPHFENENYGFGESKYQDFAKKKILVMANRTAVVLKFNEDVERATEEMGIFNADGVTVASYQKVTNEKMINAIDEADIIICDEAHYFVSDAWNGTTGIIINKILEAVEKKPVIFFTATPQLILKYFIHRNLIYKELDYRDILGFTDRMDFIASNKDLEQIIKDIPVGEKWMAFVEDNKSKKRQKNWCEKLNEEGYSVEYYHSTWIKESDGTFKGKKDWAMNGKVGLLVGQKKFDTQGALANKAIDNGIDIIDSALKHIILLNQFDHVQIQQMVGRKRFDIYYPEDRVTVYLTTESKPILEKAYEKLIEQVAFIKEYRNHHFENYSATKAFIINSALVDGMEEADMTEFINNTFMESFLSKENRRERMEDLNLTVESTQNEEYGGLLMYQLEYLAPIVRKILMEVPDEEGQFKTVEKSNIVNNYQTLVKTLFNRPSSIQWRNKNEIKDDVTVKQENRVLEELAPYLHQLEGVKLHGDEKRKFESEISYYYGASKKSNRLANLSTINEFIRSHGFIIKSKRTVINQKQRTVWIISTL
ncbi:UNVERIFIED_ORG: hypothetical protein QFZ59_004668 [Bacillus sp. B2I3]|nr:hypothetical protein [Bacillus sp. B2I3]